MTWEDDALCAEVGGDFWFPEANEHGKAKIAKDICGMCPVQLECLGFALSTNQTAGVWGGFSSRERAATLRESA